LQQYNVFYQNYDDDDKVILQLTLPLFQVKAKPEGVHFALENSLPIVIGTIPLWQDTFPKQGLTFPSPQQITLAPSAPPADTGTSFASSFPYPDMRKFLAFVTYLL
jgi:hypothetical protein